MLKFIPKIGDVYNDYIVISDIPNKAKDGHTTFKVKCKCGKEEYKQSKNLRSGKSKRCKSCASKITAKKYPPPHNLLKEGVIGTTFFNYIIHGAKVRNIEFSLSKEFLWNLIEKQNFKCNLSGLDIKITVRTNSKYHFLKDITASLDRIDSSKGYTEDNVQWVHRDINMMKQSYTQEHFINMCRIISEWQKK